MELIRDTSIVARLVRESGNDNKDYHLNQLPEYAKEYFASEIDIATTRTPENSPRHPNVNTTERRALG